MNKFLTIFCAVLLAAACHGNSQSSNSDNMPDNTIQEVAGRKNFGSANALVTTPQPCVMIATWDENKNPDVMMAAWAGQINFKRIAIKLSKHKTTENLEKTGAFTISFADERTMVESDYLGLVSGNNVPDKVARAGFTITPSPNVNAPIINEYPFTLECKVVSFDEGILIGEIINQSADESILTDGQVDLAKLRPLAFDAASMSYRTIGGIAGKAMDVGKALMESE